MKVRAFFAIAAAASLVGCFSSDPPYDLVIETATIASGPSATTAWCKDGSIPAISVVARTQFTNGTTSTSPTSLSPIWDEGILVAYASDFNRGVRIDVNGQCPEGTVHIGAARVVPGSNVYAGRALVVHGLGGASEIRLRWQPLRAASDGSGGGVYFEGGYYVDDDVGYYDESGDYVSTDPSSDSSDTSSDSATCDTSDTCYDDSSSVDTSSDDSSSSDSSSSDSSDTSSSDSSSSDSSSSDSSSSTP